MKGVSYFGVMFVLGFVVGLILWDVAWVDFDECVGDGGDILVLIARFGFGLGGSR